jgi:hypothetical protein
VPWFGVVIFSARPTLNEEQQSGVVKAPVALGLNRTEQLSGERAQRNCDPGLSGGSGHDGHVLVVEIDSSPGSEIAPQHASCLEFQDLVAGQAAGQGPDRGR